MATQAGGATPSVHAAVQTELAVAAEAAEAAEAATVVADSVASEQHDAAISKASEGQIQPTADGNAVPDVNALLERVEELEMGLQQKNLALELFSSKAVASKLALQVCQPDQLCFPAIIANQ